MKRWGTKTDPDVNIFKKFMGWVARRGKGTLDFMFENRDLDEFLAGTAYTVGAAVKRRNDDLLRGYRLANGLGGLCGLSLQYKTIIHFPVVSETTPSSCLTPSAILFPPLEPNKVISSNDFIGPILENALPYPSVINAAGFFNLSASQCKGRDIIEPPPKVATS